MDNNLSSGHLIWQATDPKNILTKEGIKVVGEIFRSWETRDKLSKVVKIAELREADYNLSPSQFVDISEKFIHREIGDILADLAAARQAREWADKDLDEVLVKLNLVSRLG